MVKRPDFSGRHITCDCKYKSQGDECARPSTAWPRFYSTLHGPAHRNLEEVFQVPSVSILNCHSREFASSFEIFPTVSAVCKVGRHNILLSQAPFPSVVWRPASSWGPRLFVCLREKTADLNDLCAEWTASVLCNVPPKISVSYERNRGGQGPVLASFGIKPGAPMAAFVKRLRCSKCGSGSVIADRIASSEPSRAAS